MAKKETFDADEYIAAVEEEFERLANKKKAAAAKAYVRDLFDYYGLTTPQRREMQQRFHDAVGLPPFEVIPALTKKLWNKPQRELQYFAMDLYEKYQKQFTAEDVPTFEYMIRNKSWWETVDFVAPKLIAALHLKHPEMQEENCQRWIKSNHMWLMRAAIIHQNLYKKKTNEPLLFDLISQCMDHEDFFIRKAIGWSLRQYGRTNPASVKKFVKANEKKLSELSRREALKHIS